MYIYFENLGFPWRTKFSYCLPYFRKVQTTNELRKTFDTDRGSKFNPEENDLTGCFQLIGMTKVIQEIGIKIGKSLEKLNGKIVKSISITD
ncbi:hypothetical protein LEP1GSC013_1449 [Leptospira interrogans serovar Valbuzzi str. Duyster]|nr:hypothetical protein LEP1GSC013_1449 [Leptospira interrogans serovar Valbuzzi str. Duyster]ENO72522.1 hypothetical protein LEP1GSC012_1088 [Leptospira interrogans serovar Valbuzzi str. Valbuzzi]